MWRDNNGAQGLLTGQLSCSSCQCQTVPLLQYSKMPCFPSMNECCSAKSIIAAVGVHEVKARSSTLQKFAAEFIGTFMLVLIGCGSTTVAWTDGYKPTTVQVALAFGLTVAFVVQSVGHVSGAHVNPAVTVGLLAVGHVRLLKALLYVLAQCAGAVVASLVLKALTPAETAATLGVTAVSPHLTVTQAVLVEALITFVLVLTVCGACFGGNAQAVYGAPFAIGLSITACHLFAMQYTGSSMNPARSLGPAMVGGLWNNHWVYWVGPLVGAVAAGITSRCLFAQTSTEETPSGAIPSNDEHSREREPLLP